MMLLLWSHGTVKSWPLPVASGGVFEANDSWHEVHACCVSWALNMSAASMIRSARDGVEPVGPKTLSRRRTACDSPARLADTADETVEA